ncbi:hypothetical protein TrST_g4926 [Triparma strigata]|uniref:J domain-containing protein n=1 Tax=Triparma strigata TaxID=1606541 RepID=A0A9W7B9V0_9STRA|nr:hypothetical protein TrST_g4926 [Triparma strigata]
MPLPKWNATIDYYSVLNLPPTSTPSEIKSSFTILAKSLHPDLNPEACPKKFASLVEAKEVLLNPDVRQIYDRERSDGWSSSRRSNSRSNPFKNTQWKEGFDPNSRRSSSSTPKHVILMERFFRPRFLFLSLPLIYFSYSFLKSSAKSLKDDANVKDVKGNDIVLAYLDSSGKYKPLKPTDSDYASKRSKSVKIKKSALA